jgi:hypothetical protein
LINDTETQAPTTEYWLGEHSSPIRATRIVKAAKACSQAGTVAEAVTIAMDIEQLIYEAGLLHCRLAAGEDRICLFSPGSQGWVRVSGSS